VLKKLVYKGYFDMHEMEGGTEFYNNLMRTTGLLVFTVAYWLALHLERPNVN
jgi:hypothetical protein